MSIEKPNLNLDELDILISLQRDLRKAGVKVHLDTLAKSEFPELYDQENQEVTTDEEDL